MHDNQPEGTSDNLLIAGHHQRRNDIGKSSHSRVLEVAAVDIAAVAIGSALLAGGRYDGKPSAEHRRRAESNIGCRMIGEEHVRSAEAGCAQFADDQLAPCFNLRRVQQQAGVAP